MFWALTKKKKKIPTTTKLGIRMYEHSEGTHALPAIPDVLKDHFEAARRELQGESAITSVEDYLPGSGQVFAATPEIKELLITWLDSVVQTPPQHQIEVSLGQHGTRIYENWEIGKSGDIITLLSRDIANRNADKAVISVVHVPERLIDAYLQRN